MEDDDTGSEFLCWGCGEFGQHCHMSSSDVTFNDSRVVSLSPADRCHQIRLAACGSSHNIVITSKYILISERRKEMFHLMTHSTHFIYGYIALDFLTDF